jgi:site-specific DNA-methyltransferase (adenine-specific)
MKDISSNSVDLIICDLPYGCLGGGGITTMSEEKRKEKYKGNTGVTIHGCSWDIKIDLKAFWEQVRRIRKDEHTPTLHFCTTKFGYELIQSNPNEFRYDLVWDKQRGVSFLSANKMPMRSHEMIYVFSKSGAFYERKDIENEGKRCVLSVIQQSSRMKKGNHPTQKPEDLYRFLIERYCPPGGTVLDPTFGSANSVFTAFSMGRSAIGIEKDEGFFKKAQDKLNALPF